MRRLLLISSIILLSLLALTAALFALDAFWLAPRLEAAVYQLNAKATKEQLNGKSGTEARAILGEPTKILHIPSEGGELWTYIPGLCFVNCPVWFRVQFTAGKVAHFHVKYN